ncbi:MAG: cyclic nucleotide-binding domain-containing protein [Ruminiclostridium sp.]|nr:cyclic nucleotide-binding domain-containing protein [Ruminiclostridium sp.]
MEGSNIRLFNENDVIVQEGSVNTEMYKIVSGQAAVYFDYGKKSEYLVGVLGERRCFGEIGLLTGKPSPFSIVAFTDMMLLSVGVNELEDFISGDPRSAAEIMHSLANTVVTMSANINMLKDELVKGLDAKADAERINTLNKSLMKYRVSGLQGSPYFSKLT